MFNEFIVKWIESGRTARPKGWWKVQVEASSYPRGHYWVQSCLISSLMNWMMGWGVSLTNLLMTQKWEESAAAIQRELNMLADRNFKKFNEGKFKVLHLGRNNLRTFWGPPRWKAAQQESNEVWKLIFSLDNRETLSHSRSSLFLIRSQLCNHTWVTLLCQENQNLRSFFLSVLRRSKMVKEVTVVQEWNLPFKTLLIPGKLHLYLSMSIGWNLAWSNTRENSRAN